MATPSERRSGRHWFENTGARRKTGLVMAYKRLEEHTFTWPAIKDGVMGLGHAQFEALFAVSKTRLRHDAGLAAGSGGGSAGADGGGIAAAS